MIVVSAAAATAIAVARAVARDQGQMKAKKGKRRCLPVWLPECACVSAETVVVVDVVVYRAISTFAL